MHNELESLENILGYTFHNRELLEQALTHSSRANELTGNPFNGNERLEFLGDAVLEEIVSSCIFFGFPDKEEGFLTKLRAAIVCEKALSHASKKLQINSYMRLGRGEELTGGRERDSLVSDCLEAVFGAVFLDGGREAAKNVIERVLTDTARDAISGRFSERDYKTALQELLQKNGVVQIEYKITGESGPDHAKCFEAGVYVQNRLLGSGTGRSKQQAQIAAARDALEKME